MLIVFLILAIAIIAICYIFGNEYSEKTGAFGVFGILCFLATAIAMLVMLSNVVRAKTLDARIEMYQSENAGIERQIEAAVERYMAHENLVFSETANTDSCITLVSLYPDLKADELVSRQIEVYLENKEKITKLKEKQINTSVYRWWLYFGS